MCLKIHVLCIPYHIFDGFLALHFDLWDIHVKHFGVQCPMETFFTCATGLYLKYFSLTRDQIWINIETDINP